MDEWLVGKIKEKIGMVGVIRRQHPFDCYTNASVDKGVSKNLLLFDLINCFD